MVVGWVGARGGRLLDAVNCSISIPTPYSFLKHPSIHPHLHHPCYPFSSPHDHSSRPHSSAPPLPPAVTLDFASYPLKTKTTTRRPDHSNDSQLFTVRKPSRRPTNRSAPWSFPLVRREASHPGHRLLASLIRHARVSAEVYLSSHVLVGRPHVARDPVTSPRVPCRASNPIMEQLPHLTAASL